VGGQNARFRTAQITLADLKRRGQQLRQETDAHHAEKLTKAVVSEIVKTGRSITESAIATIYKEVRKNNCTEEQKAKYRALRADIDALPKFGNDIDEVDSFAREVTYTYTRPMETYKNPRGGQFQAGLYPYRRTSCRRAIGPERPTDVSFHPRCDGVSPEAAERDRSDGGGELLSRIDHS
jgi:formate C-acetyltransferase